MINNISTSLGHTLADFAMLKTFLMPDYWNEELDLMLKPFFKMLNLSLPSILQNMQSSLKWAIHKSVGDNYRIYNGIISKSGIFIGNDQIFNISKKYV